ERSKRGRTGKTSFVNLLRSLRNLQDTDTTQLTPTPSPRTLTAIRTLQGDRMSSITLTVNGKPHTVDVDPATSLLYVLSDDLALRGPKFGCGLGQCGACTVIV